MLQHFWKYVSFLLGYIIHFIAKFTLKFTFLNLNIPFIHNQVKQLMYSNMFIFDMYFMQFLNKGFAVHKKTF